MTAVKISLDVFLVLVLLAGIYLGYKRGFVKSIAKPVRFFASLATALSIAPGVSQVILEPIIKAPVTNKIKDYLLENCPNITPESASEELPTLLKFAASLLDVDTATLSSENTIGAIVDALASPIVHFVSVIITFILVYFIFKLIFTLLIAMLDKFFDNRVLSVPNKLLGAFFSFFLAMAAAWVFTIVFDFVIHSAILEKTLIAEKFEGGIVYGFFNKTNPVDILLGF